MGMPQADILSFSPTLLFLPVCFLGGYFFFATHWAPRIMLTLRARHWLTSVTVGVIPSTGWPEIFLMFLQFGGLLFFASRLTLVTPPVNTLRPLEWTPPVVPTLATEALPVENFFFLWRTHREGFLFRPAGVELTHLVGRVLSQFGGYSPGKQFPGLAQTLRTRFEGLNLEEPAPHD